jgi:hypothetical protein
MPQEMCLRGKELYSKATLADDVFKNRLLDFFASVRKDDREMKEIEVLGDSHREADEAFHRHQRVCNVCAGTHVVSRYVAAD